MRKVLQRLGVDATLVEHHGRSGKTTEDAEKALGIPRQNILKCLIFKGGGGFVAAVVTGDRRVSISKLERASGLSQLRLASPEEVLEKAGFSVGGICPFALEGIRVFVDEQVFRREVVACSDGSGYVGMLFNSKELLKVGVRCEIAED